MRNPPPGSGTPTTWMAHKEQGKKQFQNEEYEQALASYRAALGPEYACPTAERQILLSVSVAVILIPCRVNSVSAYLFLLSLLLQNIVACRLKIGGTSQAAAAVEDAKQCVAINDSWAKGHVRLASGYIALGEHSNDACNSLQRAISLDPGNATARQMLMRELRRDHIAARQSSSATPTTTASSTTADIPAPTAPPEEELDEPILEESLSWTDRLKLYYMQGIHYYESQSEDRKNVIKLALVLLALYVAFGGRFGLDQLFFGNHHDNKGNYEAGNAYDRYYSRQQNYHDSYSTNNHHRQTYESDNEYRPQQQGGSQSFHFPNLFDGSPQSMICIAGIAYLCYRNGINPFQVIMMMNMVAGGRRRGMGMRHGMGMGYGGMGGMRYGGGMGGGFGGQRGFGRIGRR